MVLSLALEFLRWNAFGRLLPRSNYSLGRNFFCLNYRPLLFIIQDSYLISVSYTSDSHQTPGLYADTQYLSLNICGVSGRLRDTYSLLQKTSHKDVGLWNSGLLFISTQSRNNFTGQKHSTE